MSKLGIVFAGGGGKGSYQIGVWKALNILGISDKVSAAAGTSIGALTSVLFTQNDYDKGEHIWLNSSQKKMLPIDDRQIARDLFYLKLSDKKMDEIMQWAVSLRDDGAVVSKEGLIEMVEGNVDCEKIRNSKMECFACCTKIPERTPRYFRLNDYDDITMKSILYATTAIPLVFQSEKIEGDMYVDGGMTDNVPIKPVYESGCDIIIVVDFNKIQRVDKSLYPDAKIIEILPSKNLGGWITGTMDFSKDTSLDRILQGYKDAMRLFSPIADVQDKDMLEALKEKSDDINSILDDMMDEKKSLEDGIRKLKQLKNITDNVKNISREKYRKKKTE